jgi:DNA-binding response OmpR family regulator
MAKKILIIEDEKDIMDLVVIRLKHAGYEVIPAYDAEEGLIYLKKNIPDLIILDLFLPKMQGEEFCKKLQADKQLKKIPVIIFTAGSFDSMPPKKLKDLCAVDCIFKPYTANEMLKKIKKQIG